MSFNSFLAAAQIIGIIAVTVAGLCNVVFIDKAKYRAIENSCAHYDTKTGAFTWNDEVKK